MAQPLPLFLRSWSSAPVAAEPPVPPELPLIELLSDERAVCELVLEPCWVVFWFCSPDCCVLELGEIVVSPVLASMPTLCE